MEERIWSRGRAIYHDIVLTVAVEILGNKEVGGDSPSNLRTRISAAAPCPEPCHLTACTAASISYHHVISSAIAVKVNRRIDRDSRTRGEAKRIDTDEVGISSRRSTLCNEVTESDSSTNPSSRQAGKSD